MFLLISSDVQPLESLPSSGLIGLESFCSIVESLAPWTEKTPVEKRATRADYEEVLAEAPSGCSNCWVQTLSCFTNGVLGGKSWPDPNKV